MTAADHNTTYTGAGGPNVLQPSPVCPSFKLIPLTQGKFAIVDEADYKWLSQWKWYALKQHNGDWYAVRNQWKNGKSKLVYMHREIHKTPGESETDHRDHNGLNNRHSNLRFATTSQNQHNRKKDKRIRTSHFKGVCWHRLANKWCARITVEYQTIYLGLFRSEIEAAHVYDAAAKRYFGDFACLNF